MTTVEVLCHDHKQCVYCVHLLFDVGYAPLVDQQ